MDVHRDARPQKERLDHLKDKYAVGTTKYTVSKMDPNSSTL